MIESLYCCCEICNDKGATHIVTAKPCLIPPVMCLCMLNVVVLYLIRNIIKKKHCDWRQVYNHLAMYTQSLQYCSAWSKPYLLTPKPKPNNKDEIKQTKTLR